MRLLFLADAIFEDLPGGSRTAARELARGLIAHGHEVTFLVGRRNPDSPNEECLSDGRHVVRYDGAGQGVAFVRRGYEACRRLWNRQAYDVVHTQFALASIGPLRAIPRHIPRVRTFHGPWDEESVVQHSQKKFSLLAGTKLALVSALCRVVETNSLRHSNAVIALSQCFCDKAVTRYGVPADKVSVIPGGADTDRFVPSEDKAAVRRSLGIPTERRIILTVRRLAPRMGLENLIAAMPTIISQYPDILLMLGGKGPLKDKLETMILDLDLSKYVRLEGFISDQELASYYQAADLFVLPTIALEGFGLVTVEALASGLPVLGTPVGGTVEILSQLDSRLIAESCDPDDIAHSAISFFDGAWYEELSPARLHRFVADRFSWVQHVEKVESVYRSLIPDYEQKPAQVCVAG